MLGSEAGNQEGRGALNSCDRRMRETRLIAARLPRADGMAKMNPLRSKSRQIAFTAYRATGTTRQGKLNWKFDPSESDNGYPRVR